MAPGLSSLVFIAVLALFYCSVSFDAFLGGRPHPDFMFVLLTLRIASMGQAEEFTDLDRSIGDTINVEFFFQVHCRLFLIVRWEGLFSRHIHNHLLYSPVICSRQILII